MAFKHLSLHNLSPIQFILTASQIKELKESSNDMLFDELATSENVPSLFNNNHLTFKHLSLHNLSARQFTLAASQKA